MLYGVGCFIHIVSGYVIGVVLNRAPLNLTNLKLSV